MSTSILGLSNDQHVSPLAVFFRVHGMDRDYVYESPVV